VDLSNHCPGHRAGGDTALVNRCHETRARKTQRFDAVVKDAMIDNQPVRLHAWVKSILFMLIALMFAIFLILNMSAVIEPRVHLVFFKYERPGLLIVLLITATLGFVAGLSIRAVLATLREIRAARRRIDAASLQSESAGLTPAANMAAR
jgi:uncharacterized integral membrane protein